MCAKNLKLTKKRPVYNRIRGSLASIRGEEGFRDFWLEQFSQRSNYSQPVLVQKKGRSAMKSNSLSIRFLVVTLLVLAPEVVYASEMDNRIEAAARNSYVYKTYLHEDSIQTESKDGLVTLTGTVNEDDHKSLAEETVANLPGVKDVDNRIQVQTKHSEEKPADAWISAKVKAALLFHL